MAVHVQLGLFGPPTPEPAAANDVVPVARVRARTVSMRRLAARDLAHGRALYPAAINAADPRPMTYAECLARGLGDATACPYVSCGHHLYLDVSEETGSIKINFPDLEPDELAETCALRVAEHGGLTLEDLGDLLGLTRERIRQIERRVLRQLAGVTPAPDDLLPEGDGEPTRHHPSRPGCGSR